MQYGLTAHHRHCSSCQVACTYLGKDNGPFGGFFLVPNIFLPASVRRPRCSGDRVLVSSRDVQTRSADPGTASCLSLSPCLGLVCSVDVDVVLSSLTLLTWDEMGFVKRSGHRERGEPNGLL